MALLLNSAASHSHSLVESFKILLMLMQDESFVNAGPAVYISPSGPNPIMVQVYMILSLLIFRVCLVALMSHL